jgi:magnesium chelatase subunit D
MREPSANGRPVTSDVPPNVAPSPVSGVRALIDDLAAAQLRATGERGRRSSRASQAAESTHLGRHVRSLPSATGGELDFAATLHAAAPSQPARRAASANQSNRSPALPGGRDLQAVALRSHDVRIKQRRAQPRRLVLFVVDASGSMAGQRRLAFAKGAVESLLLDTYQRRDRVAVITFAGAGARLVLQPTNSAALARRRVRDVPAGGRTPLAAALDLAARTLDRAALGATPEAPVLVLLTDGRANALAPGMPSGAGSSPWDAALTAAGRLRRRGAPIALVETDPSGAALGLGQTLAHALGATHYRLQRTRDAAVLVRASAPLWS